MIHVLQSGNDYITKGIILNTLSMLKHTKEPIHLHVMTIEISWDKGKKIDENLMNNLREYMKEINPLNELTYYDISEDFEKTFKGTPNQNPKYTPGTLVRLLCDKYIDCDKLIYLDADILTYNSLEEFNKIDIEDKELAVVKDFMGRFWIKRDYFNAGVLYINMKKVKETKMFEKAINLLATKKYYFSDQTALYKASTLRTYMPFRFNEQRRVKPDTVIKHFCKGIQYFPYFKVYNIKQWDVKHVHSFLKMHEFDDIFAAYTRLFPQAPKLNM